MPRDQPFRTAHICEAPGAFICATNFYHNLRREKNYSRSSANQSWEWTALSLNPFYEGNDNAAMVDDDRLIVETIPNWYFGLDNSGNILDIQNIRGLWKKSSGVHLVTADGSVDSSGDPNEQESLVSELHYAEAICALGALAKNGSFVLKMFNLFECETICLLYILALHFKQLSIFKPASSRAPNAETYIIALGFHGIDSNILQALLSFVSPRFPPGKALLPLDLIPESFRSECIQIAEYFTNKQIEAIQRNLDLEQIWNRNIQQAIYKLNQDIVREFRDKCFIDYHYRQRTRIVKNIKLDGSAKLLGNSSTIVKGGMRQRDGGTLEDRQDRKQKREEFLSNSIDNSNQDRTSEDRQNLKRKREEYLPNPNDNNNEKDDEETERTTKKFVGNHGKPVTLGRNVVLASSTKTDVDDNEIQVNTLDKEPSDSKGESIAMKMMKKSGYKEGQGLGAHGQGRSAPIETIQHNNRFGLGHHNQPSLLTSASSSSSLDAPKVFDEPLFSSYDRPISTNKNRPVLINLLKTTSPNLNSVLSSLFVKFEDLENLYRKREECFDKIRIQDRDLKTTKIFISDQLDIFNKEQQYTDCESAFQLASLDQIFKLTGQIENSTRLSFIIDNKSLTGFAEYLVWQQQHFVNGLLISDCSTSFPISSSVIVKKEIDHTHPKVNLFFSDVSILPTNTKINRRYIEKYNKRQFLISCLNALTKLNQGGHFVCKVLDTLTRFTAGLIYLLYCSFESICIIRPFTVDPSSAQRFLVCKRLKYPVNLSIIQHLQQLLNEQQTENLLEVVHIKCLIESEFQQYLADTSQRLLQREIEALDKRLWSLHNINNTQVYSEEDWHKARECLNVPRRSKPPSIEPDSGITLPFGWTKQWSKREEKHYYFNEQTGESRWEPPK